MNLNSKDIGKLGNENYDSFSYKISKKKIQKLRHKRNE